MTKYSAVALVLNERARRLWAAAESHSIGFGGDALVSSATGLARETIRKGRLEIIRVLKLLGGFAELGLDARASRSASRTL